jgi:hypothetical protein
MVDGRKMECTGNSSFDKNDALPAILMEGKVLR